MNDKEKAAIRSRIEKVKLERRQDDLIAGTEPLWANCKMLNDLEGEARRNCVCALDNQRGYNMLFNPDDSFKRISIPLVRRLFNSFKTEVKSRHEGYIHGESRVASPPIHLPLGHAITADLTAFAFIKSQYNYRPYEMLDRECEDTFTLCERLSGYLDEINFVFKESDHTFLFLGLGWYGDQLVTFADYE